MMSSRFSLLSLVFLACDSTVGTTTTSDSTTAGASITESTTISDSTTAGASTRKCIVPTISLPVDTAAIDAYRSCLNERCQNADANLVNFDVCAEACATSADALVGKGCGTCAFASLIKLEDVAQVCPGKCSPACGGGGGESTTEAPGGADTTTPASVPVGSTSAPPPAASILVSDEGCRTPTTPAPDPLSSTTRASTGAATSSSDEEDPELSAWGRDTAIKFAISGVVIAIVLAASGFAGKKQTWKFWTLLPKIMNGSASSKQELDDGDGAGRRSRYYRPLYTSTPIAVAVTLTVFGTCALLALGQGLTVFEVQYAIGDAPKKPTFQYNFWDGIDEMLRLEANVLGYFLIVSSGIWPFVKQQLVFLCTVFGGRVPLLTRGRAFGVIQLLSLTGKGAFADIALVCCFVAVMDIQTELVIGGLPADMGVLPVQLGVAPRSGVTAMLCTHPLSSIT